jgi:hypothetical protein
MVMTGNHEVPAVRRRAPGRVWYVVAGLLVVAGLIGAALILWQTIGDLDENLHRLTVPGQSELSLDERGTYTIFIEHASGFAIDPAVARLELELVSEQGQPVVLMRPDASFTYTLGDRTGQAVFQFEVDQPGNFLLAGDYPNGDSGPPVVLAVSKGLGGRLFAGIGGAILLPVLTALLAVAIVVITFLARRRARTVDAGRSDSVRPPQM